MSKDYEKDDTLALWFTPRAIQDHFEVDEDDVGEWVRNATTEELVEIGQACIGSDMLYSTFHDVMVLMVEDKLNEQYRK